MKNVLLFLLIFSSSAYSFSTIVTGMLQGEQEITIKSKTQGQILKVNYKEGQEIKAGDALAIIDDTQEIIEKELALVELEIAKIDYEKTEKLKQYVSEEEILKTKENYLKKKSVYDLKVYNLDSTRIKSPIDGLITKEFVKMGESIGSAEKTFEIMQIKNLIIELDIEALKAVKLKENQALSFYSVLHGKRMFKGQIYYIGPVLDKSSGTIKVKLKLKNEMLSNKEYLFRPGTLVKVLI